MSRLVVYIAILSSVVLVLSLLGVIQGSTLGTLFSLINNPKDFFNSGFFTTGLAAIASMATGLAVAAGLLVTGKGDMAVKATFVSILLPIGFDILALAKSVSAYGNTASLIGGILIVPMAVLFVLAVLDWWGGTG